jgi:hypothetical protein
MSHITDDRLCSSMYVNVLDNDFLSPTPPEAGQCIHLSRECAV